MSNMDEKIISKRGCDLMENMLKNQVKAVIKGIIIFDIVVIIALMVCSKMSIDRETLIGSVLKLDSAAVLGLIIGSAASIFNFCMLVSSTESLVNQAGKTVVQLKFAGGYFFRFAIYVVILFIGAKLDSVSMFTAALGLLSTQVVLMVQKISAIFTRKEA